MRANHTKSFLVRLLAMAVFWLVLTDFDPRDWGLGLLAIGGGAATSLALAPPGSFRLSPIGLLLLALYFLGRSVLGGLDVAWRALSPRLPLDLGYVEYELRVRTSAARIALVHLVGLMPGTLGAKLDEDRLVLHVLDRETPVAARVAELERLVARAFEP